MRTPTRTALALVALITTTVALSACSLLGPSRDSNGRVTATSEVDSPTLLVGDCFTFVDGTNNARATLTPCAKDHAYLVIGSGTLGTSEIDKDGGVQNAVSTACSTDFDAFKAEAPTGSKPEQQFVVSTADKDGKQVTLYLCVATDTPIAG
jgi:hypothetical protein